VYLIAHDAGGGDGPKLAEVGAEPLVVQRLVQVLDVQVAALAEERRREGGREGGREDEMSE